MWTWSPAKLVYVFWLKENRPKIFIRIWTDCSWPFSAYGSFAVKCKKNPKTTFGLIGASCMNGKNCRKYFIPIPTFPIQSFHWTECQKCLNMKMKFNSYDLDLFTISYLFTFCYNQLFVYILFQLAVYLNDEIWFLCNPLFVVIL